MKGRILAPALGSYDPHRPPRDLARQLVLWGMAAYVTGK